MEYRFNERSAPWIHLRLVGTRKKILAITGNSIEAQFVLHSALRLSASEYQRTSLLQMPQQWSKYVVRGFDHGMHGAAAANVLIASFGIS